MFEHVPDRITSVKQSVVQTDSSMYHWQVKPWEPTHQVRSLQLMRVKAGKPGSTLGSHLN